MNRTRSGQFPPGVSGNPRGRPPSTRQDSASTEIVRVGRTVARNDGYTNAATGHGTSRDRRTLTRFRGTVITDLEGLDLWRSEFLAKRIVEAKPEEAMKRGWSLDCDDKDLCARMAVTADDLDLDETLTHAAQVARACGGSAILPIIEGAQGRLADPLDEEAIGEITALHVFEPRELQALDWYSDLGPKWGRPSLYAFNPLANGRLSYVGGEPIHESRLIIFPGRKITRQTLFGQRESWGDSCLTPVAEVLADFGVSWGSAATLLQHHGKETLQLAGLRDMLAHADGMEEFDRNMSAMYQAWSTLRMNVIDKDSTISRSTGTLAGVHELLAEFKELIAAAGETPMAIVFGTAGTGLRTGDTDMDAWYSTCERWRTKTLAKPHRRLVRMLLSSAAGPSNGNEPERWAIKYPPMSVPSDKEIAETRKLDAERASVLISNGIVSADDVAESFFGGEKYSGDIRVNWDRREAQAALDMGADENMGDVEPEVEEGDQEEDPGVDVEDIDDDELDAMAADDEEDVTLDDEDEDPDREDEWRDDRAIVRASDGRFGHVAGAHKGKRKPAGGRKAAPKFDAAPHRKVIDKHRAAELSNRKASLAIKERMTKIRAAAVGKSKEVRAKAKERLTELAGARDEFRALANEARANRIAASKAMTAARKEHTAKVREERASAKASKAAKAPKTKAKTAPEPKAKPDDERALMTEEAVKVNEAARAGDMVGVHKAMDTLLRERYGLQPTKAEKLHNVATDSLRGTVQIKLDSSFPPNIGAYREWTGAISFRTSSRDALREGAEVAGNIPIGRAVERSIGESQRLRAKSRDIAIKAYDEPNKSKRDALLKQEQALLAESEAAWANVSKIRRADNAATTMMHETLHGFTPVRPSAYRGLGAKIEEVTTEVAARAVMARSFGSEVMLPSLGSYNWYISPTVDAIARVTGRSHGHAYEALQNASLRFKQRPGSSLSTEAEVRSAFVADIAHVLGDRGGAMTGKLNQEMKALEDANANG